MVHALHDYLAGQLAKKLKERRVVVWYDPREELRPFVNELRAQAGDDRDPAREIARITPDGVEAGLAECRESFFALRALVEPHVACDRPEPLLVYVPSAARDRHESVLCELELAGECQEPQLRRLARNVLRRRMTDGVIDELLSSERLGYEDLRRLLEAPEGEATTSILRTILRDSSTAEGLLADWLANDANDHEIEEKHAKGELLALLRSRLALEPDASASLAALRTLALRYVLVGEFRGDLIGIPAPPELDIVAKPPNQEVLGVVRKLARQLRAGHADAYVSVSDAVDRDLQVNALRVPAEALGSIDTFRFEERILLSLCSDYIADGRFDEADRLIRERVDSFWLRIDADRQVQWESCRRMAEVGRRVAECEAVISKLGRDPAAWVDAYARQAGLFRADQAQRRLEAWVGRVAEEPEAERALARVRRSYDDLCSRMAQGFTDAFANAGWSISGFLAQPRVFASVVKERTRPLAYFLVDALRFEMGAELAERLGPVGEVGLRPALSALPSITTVGMAALLPGAEAGFGVVASSGRLMARIEGQDLPDLAARKRHFANREPGLLDLTLDELIALSATRLTSKVAGAQLIVVRSQEIDAAGEGGFTALARPMMDTILDQITRAIRKLASAGIADFVLSADHGHLFSLDRGDEMKLEPPGGETIELHRRCWAGRGGKTPTGCLRVTGAALGYETDLDFVFPRGAGVFRTGGDLAFHHGGASLQEVVIPVVTLRVRPQAPIGGAAALEVQGLPDAVTNRILSVTIRLGRNLELFGSEARSLRPVLIAAGNVVGVAGMAVGAPLDNATGCIALAPGEQVTVGLLLTRDDVAAVRIVVQDPLGDAVLYQSADLPVRLGI